MIVAHNLSEGDHTARDYLYGPSSGTQNTLNPVCLAGAKQRPDIALKYIHRYSFSEFLSLYAIGCRTTRATQNTRAHAKRKKEILP